MTETSKIRKALGQMWFKSYVILKFINTFSTFNDRPEWAAAYAYYEYIIDWLYCFIDEVKVIVYIDLFCVLCFYSMFV